MDPPRTRPAPIFPRARLWAAWGVALAALGIAPAGRRAAGEATEAMRDHLLAAVPGAPRLSYLRNGDAAGPRLILVHGTPGSAASWSDYLLDPPAGFDVIALDRPGFGHSGPAGALPSLADQAAAVRALMPDDGRPVVLLGHSLGGPVVARVAADHPERVSAIVLLSASLDPALEEIHPMQYVGAWRWVKALLPRVLRNSNDELLALKAELEMLATALPRISATVIIVHGTQDVLVPVANVPYMQQQLSGARCVKTVLLEGRNHFLPWNSHRAVRDAIEAAREPAC